MPVLPIQFITTGALSALEISILRPRSHSTTSLLPTKIETCSVHFARNYSRARREWRSILKADVTASTAAK
ncbi:hypothetical protein EYR40_002778 [Pleurotus pulmonarius]|nr:hypothetical protein EYR40_002778 [Pleurotus pulmonarius]